MTTRMRRPYRPVTPAAAQKRAEVFGSLLGEDVAATLAGVALSQACGGTGAIASAAGVEASNARRYANGEKANPAYRVRQILERAKDPFAVCAYFLACAVKGMLVKDPMPEWRWRSLYMEAMRAEQHPDGHEDVVSTELLTGKSTLRAQYEADSRHVTALLRRMALGFIGQQMGYSLNGPRPS